MCGQPTPEKHERRLRAISSIASVIKSQIGLQIFFLDLF
jgi:hypothetical protein